jgi:amino acid adenylation domain-containing protein
MTIADAFPLTPTQEGILFDTLRHDGTGTYCQQLTCLLLGELDSQCFEAAWRHIAKAHSVLRTGILWERVVEPQQVVFQEVCFEVPVIDLDGCQDPHAKFRQICEDDRRRGFVLSRAPLFRITLCRIAPHIHRLVVTFHHILLDGWSLSILIRDFFAVYHSLIRGINPNLDPGRPFKEYVEWLRAQDSTNSQTFWQRNLQGFRATSRILPDLASNIDASGVAVEKLELSSGLVGELRAANCTEGLTLNTVLQGAWALLLSRYNGKNDVIWGTTLSGRDAGLEQTDSIVGLLISTMPCRIQTPPWERLAPWLKHLQAQLLDVQEHSRISLSAVYRCSEIPAPQPLFDTLFVFENYPLVNTDGLIGGDLRIRDVSWLEQAPYSLTVGVLPGSNLLAEAIYDRAKYESASIRRMLCHWKNLLVAMAKFPDAYLGDLTMLGSEERAGLVEGWNRTGAEMPTVCVHRLFEAQVARTPGAVALIDGERQVTFAELDRFANRVAHRLRGLGADAETPVGICAERSLEMVAGLLGVLKAGAAFVPLDPYHPPDRLAVLMREAEVGVVICQGRWAGGLRQHARSVLELDAPNLLTERADAIDIACDLDQLAYVIFTSGSTGTPKGVMISHRAIANHCSALIEECGLDAKDRVVQFSAVAFDTMVEEVLPALTSGATLVIVTTDVGLDQWWEWIDEKQATVINLPTAFWHELMRSGARVNAALPARVRLAIIGGEKALFEPCRIWWDVSGQRVPLLNTFGPTETTITAVAHRLTAVNRNSEQGDPPIGRPIANMRAYVLDGELEPVPVGVVGELYLSGVGLARGYIGRPELTAERFLADPFAPVEGARMYRTGDLASFRSDGALLYRGRCDDQVKIRGHRIEPAEIEAVLRAHADVDDCVVLADRAAAGGTSLLAVVVATEATALSAETLRRFLAGRLPPYMIPARFARLPALPLTVNGKVDRRAALAAPPMRTVEREHLRMRTPTEEVLGALWADLLDLQQVAPDDNFFELGGHSLLAAKCVARISARFGLQVAVRSMFEFPILADMAIFVDRQHRGTDHANRWPLFKAGPKASVPLTVAQKQLWEIEHALGPSSAFNVPVTLRLLGPIDIEALQKACVQVVFRHHGLRTIYMQSGEQTLQRVLAAPQSILDVEDLHQHDGVCSWSELRKRVIEEVRRPFDLSRESGFRAKLFSLHGEDHVLVAVTHHGFIDEWSMHVMIRELIVIYGQLSLGLPVPLPELALQFSDYAVWQREWLLDTEARAEIAFWQNQLAPAIKPLDFLIKRTDHRRLMPQVTSTTIAPQLVDRIRTLGQRCGGTLFMTLLAAYNVLLYRYSRQTCLRVGTMVANRVRPGTEDIVGLFTNTVVLQSSLAGDPPFRELLERVITNALDAYSHQELPFEIVARSLEEEYGVPRASLFQTMFLFHESYIAKEVPAGITIESLDEEFGIRDAIVAPTTFALVFDLTLGADGSVRIVASYAPSVFNPSKIADLLILYNEILRMVTNDPLILLSSLTAEQSHESGKDDRC